MALTLCACSHPVDGHHPAGRCTATLPPFLEEELPAWQCPCRGVVESRVTSLLLRSVQSCTVGAPSQAPHQRIRGPITPGDARVPAGDRLWRLRRTRA